MQAAARPQQSVHRREKKQAGREVTPEKCTCERLYSVCLSTPCSKMFHPPAKRRSKHSYVSCESPSRLVCGENTSSHCYMCFFTLESPPTEAAQHAERWSSVGRVCGRRRGRGCEATWAARLSVPRPGGSALRCSCVHVRRSAHV